MDFAIDASTDDLRQRLQAFMDEFVYPSEPLLWTQLHAAGDLGATPEVMDTLRQEARQRDLWNLFMRDPEWGPGLRNLEYAPLAEITGRSPLIAPEAINSNAPDSGNMEILAEFGTAEQQQEWLAPLTAGHIRSCFAMTEPDVASSDATNIHSTIERRGDDYVINGRKWWVTGAGSPRTAICLFLGESAPDADRHHRHSLVLVPMNVPGVSVIRHLPVYGAHHGGGGHCEMDFRDVHVPVSSLVGEEGHGFDVVQARLGPGRVHHCMRLLGMAERAFGLMCERVGARQAFGKPLGAQGMVRHWIAQSRVRIEQARLLVLKTAWLMDTVGVAAAQTEISAIKIVVPQTAAWVIDRAIQAHGAGGFTDDLPLTMLWTQARTLQIADGPDEVHEMALARRELAAASARPLVGAAR